jgi:hypothetical protein
LVFFAEPGAGKLGLRSFPIQLSQNPDLRKAVFLIYMEVDEP